MIFKLDMDAKKVLEQLCDLALRSGGVGSLQAVNTILSKIELINESPKAVEEE